MASGVAAPVEDVGGGAAVTVVAGAGIVGEGRDCDGLEGFCFVCCGGGAGAAFLQGCRGQIAWPVKWLVPPQVAQ